MNLAKLKVIGYLPKGVLYFLLLGLTLGVFVEIVERFVPGMALYGIPEVIELIAAYLYLTAMAYVTYRKAHVSVDLLHMVVKKETTIRHFEFVSSLIGMAVTLVFTWLAVKYCYNVAITGQTTPDIGYPRIVLVSSLIVGLTLTCVFFALELGKQLKRDITRR